MTRPVRRLDRVAVESAFRRRDEAGTALAGDADQVAAACHAMAARFHRGGRLLVFGNGAAATDAAHLAVEFIHPVIVGKRALPALSLTNDAAYFSGLAAAGAFVDTFAAQVRLLARPEDIALGISGSGRCANVAAGLVAADQLGLLTVALVGDGTVGDGPDIAAIPAVAHVIRAHSSDPHIVKEVHVTVYHVLWELVHVFLEQPGLLGPAVIRS
ncbi:MAG: SIS domain-containing protein [Geodermatophilaceae bacterium]|nr:SIS domain-containing protein [Geodermatophilaceae bacterium]